MNLNTSMSSDNVLRHNENDGEVEEGGQASLGINESNIHDEEGVDEV